MTVFFGYGEFINIVKNIGILPEFEYRKNNYYLILIKYKGLWGFINDKGDQIAPFIYDDTLGYAHGLTSSS
jgi:hypothetical protein